MSTTLQWWRLHHLARLDTSTSGPTTLSCAGRRWELHGLAPQVAQWLTSLGPWPRLLPPPDHPQAARLARWLHHQGLATRSVLTSTTLVSRGYSYLRAPVAARLSLNHLAWPQPDDLALFRGLVVLEDSEYDRTRAWLLRRAGVPHVVVELTTEGARVGAFLAARGCAGCDDLNQRAQRPLLGLQPDRTRPRPAVPMWMSDWAANQVVLAVRRWQAGVDLSPGWWWLDAQGLSGHRPVVPHRACCGQDSPAAAA